MDFWKGCWNNHKSCSVIFFYFLSFSQSAQEHLKESLCSLSTEEAIQVGRVVLQYHVLGH